MTKSEGKPTIAVIQELVAQDSDLLREIVRETMQAMLEAEMDENHPVKMPERLFIHSLSGRQQSCLRTELPKGYQLARLSRPVKPTHVGWRKGDLPLASTERGQSMAE
jgi:hypothetical protein